MLLVRLSPLFVAAAQPGASSTNRGGVLAITPKSLEAMLLSESGRCLLDYASFQKGSASGETCRKWSSGNPPYHNASLGF